MAAHNVLRQVQETAGSDSPTARRRSELQTSGNELVAARQRPVLPEGTTCGLWSFTVPWAPFEHYLQTLAHDAKPFLWSQPFRLGGAEFMAFFGIERMEAESGRLALWMGVCNNLSLEVTVYNKMEVWMPGNLDTSPCGDSFLVGDAVDCFAPCGQNTGAGTSFGRFWWHLAPTDIIPCLYRGNGDAEGERSFDVLISLRLNPSDTRTRTPARNEDPHLWEVSKKYLQPWVQSVSTARVTAVCTPLHNRIDALMTDYEGLKRQRLEELREAAEREERKVQELHRDYGARLDALEQRRQEEAHQFKIRLHQMEEEVKQEQQLRLDAQREKTQLQDRLREAAQREEQLHKHAAQLREQAQAAAQREVQLRQRGQQLEQRLAEACAREEALRKRGQELEHMLAEAAQREQQVRDQLAKLHDYIQGTVQREERFKADIQGLEARLRDAGVQSEALRRRIAVVEGEKRQCLEAEQMLRTSNSRLLAAAVDEHGRVQAIQSSPQRHR
eukprot:TRINITY_DN50846_c0_g1_i1.p1 TRINITY_DN50846_c0_g1~~TRINITY_DN50846_c0_g1_i1.p1  ORF type:complete len:531 (+),score=199.64 TRINITY_DN50846_c0_g1_i1:93-1595(+)